MQQANKLNKHDISKLEQNYIYSDSASIPFVKKIEKLYSEYIDTQDASPANLTEKLENLYDLASEISPAALPYAELTTLIFINDTTEEATGYFIKILEDFYINKFKSKKSDDQLTKADETAISVLAKTKEHLSLALNQKNNLYNEQKKELADLKNILAREQAQLKKLQDDTDAYKDKYDKMTIDFLSMMGIFSTIIFAVFGGLSQIGAIGDNLAETPISKILMYISLSAITLILIVFISFNAISKLTGLKLKSCSCKNEEECSCTIRQKHPTLSFSLFFFVDLFLFSLVLKAVRYSDWVNPFKDMFILKADNIMKFLIFGIFIIFNFLVLLKLLWPKTKCLGWIKFI
ncbi:hypothetical protein FBR74_001394 [Enterococcus faecalis]|nr:hypothetical protein [Enterococcus faecalis]EGO8066537.1 hypothetical protein [Enterococcus faecalis]EGO8192882.1 hypothetical protein [Enterococcus faecalis]EGO8482957.1 hypothetical protein [Enterococcus faecalis]EJX8001006.1 hypothetical protein [Enterococcus faecalis]